MLWMAVPFSQMLSHFRRFQCLLKDFSADNFAWSPRFVSETKKQLKESMHELNVKHIDLSLKVF